MKLCGLSGAAAFPVDCGGACRKWWEEEQLCLLDLSVGFAGAWETHSSPSGVCFGSVSLKKQICFF